MTANISTYFGEFKNTNEQGLMNDLNRETIQIYGMALQYLPRDITSQNDIFGEVTHSTFDDAYGLEFYLDSHDSFETEEVLAEMGIDMKTTFSFIVHKDRFETEVTTNEPSILRPREGDLVYVPMATSIYEITKVEKFESYFQFQKRFVWKIITELYTVDGDTIDTGIPDIDDSVADVEDGTHQVNAGDSADPTIEDTIVADDWLDVTETNPFGDIIE